jgi:hypothetical protein
VVKRISRLRGKAFLFLRPTKTERASSIYLRLFGCVSVPPFADGGAPFLCGPASVTAPSPSWLSQACLSVSEGRTNDVGKKKYRIGFL